MKQILLAIYVVAGFLLTGCSSHTGTEITHLPFKADREDRWGLIGVDGKVLFENEFENEPSVVVNGIFYVQNPNGHYEYYRAEAKPKPLNNKNYLAAGSFIEDVAPVVEPEQPVSFINKDGSTAFVLDKYKNDRIVEVRNFSEGLAVFKTQKDRYGYIDVKGKVVIEPRFHQAADFSEGLAVVWSDDQTAWVINRKGTKQFDLKTKPDENQRIATFGKYSDGLMACGYCKPESDDYTIEYYLDKKGNKALTVPDKVWIPASKSAFRNGYVSCCQSSNDKILTGLMDKKGQIVIRPKYESDYEFQAGGRIENKTFCVSDKEKYGIVDLEDNTICPFEFDAIRSFLDGRHAFARKGKYWYAINKKGEKIDHAEYAVISGVDNTSRWESFTSDWFDAEAFADKLFKKLTDDGFETFRLGSSLSEKVASAGLEAKNCRQYKHRIQWPHDTEDSYSKYSIFLESQTTPVVQSITEQVYKGWWEGWQTRTTGYRFNPKSCIDFIELQIEARWPFSKRNGLERLYRAIEGYFEAHQYAKFEWNDYYDAYKHPSSQEKIVLLLRKKAQLDNDNSFSVVVASDARKKNGSKK